MNEILPLQIAIISGTNRKDSYSMKVAMYVKAIIGALGQKPELLDLKVLPIDVFTSSVYEAIPSAFLPWQKAITECDALFIITPEYNGGIPGILKYFLDLLAYPHSIKGKPVAIAGITSGNSDASNARSGLRHLLNFQKAEVFYRDTAISKCKRSITPDGEIDSTLSTMIHQNVSEFIVNCRAMQRKHTSSPV